LKAHRRVAFDGLHLAVQHGDPIGAELARRQALGFGHRAADCSASDSSIRGHTT